MFSYDRIGESDMVAVVMGYEYPFDIFKCQTYRFEPFGYSRHIDPGIDQYAAAACAEIRTVAAAAASEADQKQMTELRTTYLPFSNRAIRA